MGSDTARSVLVIRAGALGDFVLTLPVLEAIRRRFPEARITLLGYPAIAELALASGRVDALVDVSSARFAPLFGATNTPPAELQAWLSGSSGSPGSSRLDAAVAVWSDAPSFLAPKLHAAGIREVFCVEPMPPAGEGLYAAEFMLRQLPAGWRHGVACEPSLELTGKGVRAADLPGTGAGPLCAVAPGSGGRGPERNWPPARFAEVCEGAATELGMQPFLIHGPADDEAVAAVLGLVDLPVVRGLSTVQLAATLAASDAYVGNDSGVSHLSAAVGTPTVAVFGCTDPLVWGPRGGHVRVLDPGFPGCVEIDRISAGDVLETLRVLRRAQDREGPSRPPRRRPTSRRGA